MAVLKKAFAWSYSGLKAFELCALQWQQVQLLKNFKSEKGPELQWGDRVHLAFKKTLQINGPPLPDEMLVYQKWVNYVKSFTGDRYVEQKYAITKDFAPCEYFHPTVWARGIGDVVLIDGRVATVIDWKTGKVLDDPVQLMLLAQLVFSHFPAVTRVIAQFVWLKFDATSEQVVTRQDIANNWVGLLERVHSMQVAYDTGVFPPKPSGLCKRHCPVRTCQYHGKGSY